MQRFKFKSSINPLTAKFIYLVPSAECARPINQHTAVKGLGRNLAQLWRRFVGLQLQVQVAMAKQARSAEERQAGSMKKKNLVRYLKVSASGFLIEDGSGTRRRVDNIRWN